MQTNQTMETKRVAINELRAAPHNPPKRISGSSIRALMKSIEEIGLQYPILVTPKYEIVDGHRRWESCKKLGWTEIPILITVSDSSQAYADLNALSMHQNGNGVLFIYLQNPTKLTATQKSKCERAETLLGRKLMSKLYHTGASLQTFNIARQAATYCDRNTASFIRACTRWVMEFGVTQMREALESKVAVAVLFKAVENMQEMKTRKVVE